MRDFSWSRVGERNKDHFGQLGCVLYTERKKGARHWAVGG